MLTGIWVITGVPGAGKSSLSRALCARAPRSVHIEVDDLRHMVKNGYVSPGAPPSEEQWLQLNLARQTAAEMATRYADGGFFVTIDDVVTESDIAVYRAHFGTRVIRWILLAPSLECALRRNSARPLETSNGSAAARSTLDAMIRRLHPAMSANREGWIVVDSSDLSAEQTVDAVLTGSLAPPRG